MLRIDPRQRQRLIEIIHSLNDRIREAMSNGWLGEAEALQVSLEAAGKELAALDRAATRVSTRIADLGIPADQEPKGDLVTRTHRTLVLSR
ncbi:hypothetical protein ACFZAT_32295 [Streptomyces sp. NPDC008163]|uniref:hypothetical protein n=1 Tax=Streptomyces sp. NPDC008163 TaxID=3364818 RepID=UPI0036E46DFA